MISSTNKSKGFSDLALECQISYSTINKIFETDRQQNFSVHRNVNQRYRYLKYGIKRLSKIEKQIEDRLKKNARQDNKSYPGEMIHFDMKRLPLLEGETRQSQKEYLFVAIDDYSRELFAAILPNKTQYSAERFLGQVLEETAYTIEKVFSDNGKEFKGDPDHHAFMRLCIANHINQTFTHVQMPRLHEKAERVIRTLMEQWHHQTHFVSSAHRKNELKRFVNYYNSIKPHISLKGLTPMEILNEYFYPNEL
jgi:transposase InsO family protein